MMTHASKEPGILLSGSGIGNDDGGSVASAWHHAIGGDEGGLSWGEIGSRKGFSDDAGCKMNKIIPVPYLTVLEARKQKGQGKNPALCSRLAESFYLRNFFRPK
jgi:hypothetical protein